MRILGLIPARGGSKGIPRKNLVPFLGVSLLERACRGALEARSLSTVIVSTDDQEMASVAKALGVRVPFLRPDDLASDGAPTLGVVQHALRELAAADEHFDAVCLLQPTNPLRLPVDIDTACDQLRDSDATAVVSVAPVPHEHHPYWAYVTEASGALVSVVPGPVVPRRQDLPKAWVREGAVYVTRTATVLEAGSLYGDRVLPYEMPVERSGNIDTPADYEHLVTRARQLGWKDTLPDRG